MKDIYNYLYYNEKLSSSGMPTPEQLTSVAEAGVKVVINLATLTSEGAIPNEGELVNGLGMEYINIPVDWKNPTHEDLDNFLSTMDNHKDESVLVHCQANYRASGFVALYQILKLGWKRTMRFSICKRYGTLKNTLSGICSSKKICRLNERQIFLLLVYIRTKPA